MRKISIRHSRAGGNLSFKSRHCEESSEAGRRGNLSFRSRHCGHRAKISLGVKLKEMAGQARHNAMSLISQIASPFRFAMTNKPRLRTLNFELQTILCSLFLALSILTLSSCSNSTNKPPLDTTTSGEIKIAIDEGYKPIMEGVIDTFHALYPRAHITTVYTSEAEAFDLLLKDSVRCIVAARTLNEFETQHFKKIPLTARNIKIGYDALALVVNNANPDSLLTYEQCLKIFSGDVKSWKELNDKSSLGEIQRVYDKNGSSTFRQINEEFNQGKEPKGNSFAVKSNPEVIDYVEKNPNAIGIIGTSWVNDADDSTALSFIKRVNVVAIKPSLGSEHDDEYFKPYQAYIATSDYPLIRTIYIVSREARTGLGTGFASFVAGDKGQRMMLKSGLVPATAPIRLIQFKK